MDISFTSVIHRRRLVILAASSDEIDFNTLIDSLQLTKGNLSSHIKKLEEAKLINVIKKFVGKIPRTTYTCTENGKKELQIYLNGIEAFFKGIN